MQTDISALKRLIEGTQKVLVTSHISPDPDAISSVLLMGTTLRANYPDKNVTMVMEEEPEGLDFLAGYRLIEFRLLDEAIRDVNPALVILLDGQRKYERFSRHGADNIRQYIKSHPDIKVAVIDHHEPEEVDKADVFINQGSIACVQDVYEVCFDHLNLSKPDGYGPTAMAGLYTDSGGFIYDNTRHRQMFRIIDELMDDRVNLENLSNRLNSYSDEHMEVLRELFNNLSHSDGYNYTFVSDGFTRAWLKDSKSQQALATACGIFVDQYIRNVGGRQWGFTVRPDLVEGPGHYSASFRSVSGVRDVSEIAKRLGGGGHKPAAGTKLTANNVEEAVAKAKDAIQGL